MASLRGTVPGALWVPAAFESVMVGAGAGSVSGPVLGALPGGAGLGRVLQRVADQQAGRGAGACGLVGCLIGGLCPGRVSVSRPRGWPWGGQPTRQHPFS